MFQSSSFSVYELDSTKSVGMILVSFSFVIRKINHCISRSFWYLTGCSSTDYHSILLIISLWFKLVICKLYDILSSPLPIVVMVSVSQNCWSWQGSLEIIFSNPPAQNRLNYSRLLKIISSWVSNIFKMPLGKLVLKFNHPYRGERIKINK